MTATCARCRRTVTPRSGPLGRNCPRCGAFLPLADPPAKRRPRASSPLQPRAEIAAQVGEELLAHVRGRVSTVGELAEFHQATTRLISRAAEQDAKLSERRERAQYWRESLPGLARAVLAR